jgi:hypothetical protein
VFGAGYQKSQSDNLGQIDFMRLLVAQMRNQNPLEPQNSAEFMAQLAQFESLNQMKTVARGMQIMQAMTELSSATGMIGKTVTATQVDATPVTRDMVGRELFNKPYIRLTSIERADVDMDQRVKDALVDAANAGTEISGVVDKVVTSPDGIPMLMVGGKVVDLFSVAVVL